MESQPVQRPHRPEQPPNLVRHASRPGRVRNEIPAFDIKMLDVRQLCVIPDNLRGLRKGLQSYIFGSHLNPVPDVKISENFEAQLDGGHVQGPEGEGAFDDGVQSHSRV